VTQAALAREQRCSRGRRLAGLCRGAPPPGGERIDQARRDTLRRLAACKRPSWGNRQEALATFRAGNRCAWTSLRPSSRSSSCAASLGPELIAALRRLDALQPRKHRLPVAKLPSWPSMPRAGAGGGGDPRELSLQDRPVPERPLPRSVGSQEPSSTAAWALEALVKAPPRAGAPAEAARALRRGAERLASDEAGRRRLRLRAAALLARSIRRRALGELAALAASGASARSWAPSRAAARGRGRCGRR